MILTGTKIKVTLTILNANHRVFQISNLRLTFPFKTKQRFLHEGITSLKEKVTTIRFDFTKCPNFSCRSRMEVSLKIYVIEQSLIMNCHYKSFYYRESYQDIIDKLLFQRVLHTGSNVLVTFNTAYLC